MTETRPAHRPSDYTEEKAEDICIGLIEGRGLVQICRDEEMPHLSTVYRWLERYPEFREKYARARTWQAETMADMALDLAMNAPAGVDPNRLRIKVDTVKWAAGKLRPTKFGEANLLKKRADMEFEREMIDITPDKDVDSDMPQLDRKQLARVVWHMLKSKQQEVD